jgi:hypothetical protein
MSASKLKGSLLEYIVRRLLLNCGFTNVVPDGLLIFKRSGLTMINGKGAAHDADVLMNPPIQMPFSYPSRLNFECKAYKEKSGLPIIRNALGLRYDINNFEVITRQHLDERMNNRRSTFSAIDNRQRFNYQVGVASVEDFTRPAFEFAANNKIPLLSLRWFLPDDICDSFHEITDTYVSDYSSQQIRDLLSFLKGERNNNGQRFIEETESIFKRIYNTIEEIENRVLIGLLESGDLLFLFSQNIDAMRYVSDHPIPLNTQFHYEKRDLDYWSLTINEDQNVKFGFYLPINIVKMWENQNFDRDTAVRIKAQMFSKVFVFIKNSEIPFRILKIDRMWLDKIGAGD